MLALRRRQTVQIFPVDHVTVEPVRPPDPPPYAVPAQTPARRTRNARTPMDRLGTTATVRHLTIPIANPGTTATARVRIAPAACRLALIAPMAARAALGTVKWP